MVASVGLDQLDDFRRVEHNRARGSLQTRETLELIDAAAGHFWLKFGFAHCGTL